MTRSPEDILHLIRSFRSERNWEPFHTPKNLAFSISIEAAELLEIFQWVESGESDAALENPDLHAAASDELADVLIYCLYFADRTGIDPIDAILKKIAINEHRFPAAREEQNDPEDLPAP